MTETASLSWSWCARSEALPAQAALAWGARARLLHQHLGRIEPERLSRLSATANRDLLFVSGAGEDLPWLDGIAYAAPCPEAPALWLPTHYQPDAPAELLARALQVRHQRQPLLLWPEPAAVVPLDRLLPLSTVHLQGLEQLWSAGQR